MAVDIDLEAMELPFGFETTASQQFATVLFDRPEEDSTDCKITVITRDGMVNQFMSNNTHNPSIRRHASCVYVMEEFNNTFMRICTIQHKGITLLEVEEVFEQELIDLGLAEYIRPVDDFIHP
ncbi:hypothetical protein [Endozoicomonas ascidiicola]|uniref:hypothetical protein n=1 Tax=Endozoicomonas ascidiicola TaxID=1698521 RepID=UPI0008336A92|nr:hypothetical protein [Endozoicomonas ascidiicola]